MRLFSKAPIDTKLSALTLSDWASHVVEDPTLRLAMAVASNTNVSDSLIRDERKAALTSGQFSNIVVPEGEPRMNQRSSGRCWLFAACNMLRLPIMKQYNLEKFELSPRFLFFYDKLEKANFFLDQIVKTADLEVDSRLVQHLLAAPVNDGGQFNMFANIAEKYGMVPMSAFPESATTKNSHMVNQLVTTMLRQYAQELRAAVQARKDPKPLQHEMIKKVHQLLVVFLGVPPTKFDWDYTTKDDKTGSVKNLTPLRFYKEIVKTDAMQCVSLLNDPRNPYERPVHVERLGNVVESGEVTYFNAPIDVLARKAIERIKQNKGVFFGTHTPIYHDNASGIIDTQSWDYEALGFNPTQNKADRLRYGESLMTHAMVLVGVHLDTDGNPVRWKVENSWSEKSGLEGYYTMSHDFFKEYVYQVVVDKDEVPEYADKFEDEPIRLAPWDPCGALAN